MTLDVLDLFGYQEEESLMRNTITGTVPERSVEVSEAPWSFVPLAPVTDAADSQDGWILPRGATEDDPSVAYVERVGALDLAAILAAPELLAATEALRAEVEGLLCGEVSLPLVTRTALAACLGLAEAAITRARSRMPVGGN